MADRRLVVRFLYKCKDLEDSALKLDVPPEYLARCAGHPILTLLLNISNKSRHIDRIELTLNEMATYDVNTPEMAQVKARLMMLKEETTMMLIARHNEGLHTVENPTVYYTSDAALQPITVGSSFVPDDVPTTPVTQSGASSAPSSPMLRTTLIIP